MAHELGHQFSPYGPDDHDLAEKYEEGGVTYQTIMWYPFGEYELAPIFSDGDPDPTKNNWRRFLSTPHYYLPVD